VSSVRATVVVPTRNRADRVVGAVRALLASATDGFEIVVVDQSEDDATRAALAKLGAGDDVRYERSAGPGSAAARNIGIGTARAEIVGLTDDDCEVSTDWIAELIGAFALDSRIGVVFGDVVAAPHDPAAGFIPAHIRQGASLACSPWERHRVDGMAACMGVRRSVWESLGGFDAMLGSGAPLRSGAEGDLALRALAAGHFVLGTPRLRVLHRGFRDWQEGRSLITSYWYGTGAAMAKPLKRGRLFVYPLLARLSWRWAFGRSPVAASLGARSQRRLRLSAFLRGFAAGTLTPVERSSDHYGQRRSRRRRRRATP
jgi:glycosyltransferase involved in cell wall biosynthesis